MYVLITSGVFFLSVSLVPVSSLFLNGDGSDFCAGVMWAGNTGWGH